jgi:hypothetical protein
MDTEAISNVFLLILGILLVFAVGSYILVSRSTKETKA